MPEPIFGLTAQSAKVIKDIAAAHQQRLPAVGRRTRRIFPGGGVDPKIVVIQSTVGPGKAGTGRVYEITNEDPVSGDTITIAAVSPTEDIVVLNFRPNYLAVGVAYIAHHVAGNWVIENDACFQDFTS